MQKQDGDDTDRRLFAMLLGRDDLELPPTSTFAPLSAAATNLPSTTTLFATHTSYRVPRESAEPLADTVHRFALQRHIADPLNRELLGYAIAREEDSRAKEALRLAALEAHDPAADVPEDLTVRLSNHGGYQSFHDIFEPSAAPPCRELKSIIASAMDILGDEASSCMYPDTSAIQSAAERHPGYAWMNLNRAAHCNILHTHIETKWCAVYFVSEGEPNAPGFPSPTGGHLVFRSGPPQLVSGEASTHSYMPVAPLPGTLWFFPGNIAHLVMPNTLPVGLAEPLNPRVSISANFEAATPPPEHYAANAWTEIKGIFDSDSD